MISAFGEAAHSAYGGVCDTDTTSISSRDILRFIFYQFAFRHLKRALIPSSSQGASDDEMQITAVHDD
jgi:hypothetical protein